MKYCKNCGHQLKENAAFCPECGETAAGKSAQVKTAAEQPSRQKMQEQKPKERWSVKKKATVFSIIGAIILLFAAFQTAKALTDKEHTAKAFVAALNDKDAGKLAGLVYSDDDNLKISKKKVAPLFDYMKDHPDYKKVLIDDVQAQAKSQQPVEGEVFTLQKHGKLLGLVDRYQFRVQPYFMTLATNYKDAELYVNGKKTGHSSSDDFSKTFGPYFPGHYSVKSELKNKYATMTSKADVDFVGLQDGPDSVDLSMDGGYLTVINGTGVKSRLMVNGKDTGLFLGQEGARVGPVNMDGSTKVQAEFALPWGKVKTEPMAVDSTEVYFDTLPVTDDQKKAVMEALNGYYKNRVLAYSKRDASQFKNVSGMGMLKNLGYEIDNMKEYDEYWTGKFVKARYDMDSFYMTKDDNDRYMVNVNSESTFQEAFYDAGDTPEMDTEVNTVQNSLVYDEDKKTWSLEDQSYAFGELSSDHELKEFDNSDGKVMKDTAGDISHDDIKTLIDDYENDLVYAINNNSFEDVAADLTEGSDLYKAQKSLVKNLNDKGITESLHGYEVTSIEGTGDEITILVNETIDVIDKDNNSKTHDYKWKYTAVKSGDGYTLSKIEKQ